MLALLDGVRRVTGSSGRSGSRCPTASSWPRTLYLPDPAVGPQPCLLEALPYRKDDLTSSYAESYVALRDRYDYAVCRVDVRGTGLVGAATPPTSTPRRSSPTWPR